MEIYMILTRKDNLPYGEKGQCKIKRQKEPRNNIHKVRPAQNHLPTMPFPQGQNPSEIFFESPGVENEQTIQQSSYAWPVYYITSSL